MFDAQTEDDSSRRNTPQIPDQPYDVPVPASLGRGKGEGRIRRWLNNGDNKRPFGFWQWDGLGTYIEFLAGLIVVLGVSQVILGRWGWYINA